MAETEYPEIPSAYPQQPEPAPQDYPEPFPQQKNTEDAIPDETPPLYDHALPETPEMPADPFAGAFRNDTTAQDSADDPFIPPHADDPFAQSAALAEEPPKPRKFVWTWFLLAVCMVMIAGFAAFSIVWDVKKGTAVGGYRAGDVVEVFLTQQKKPVMEEGFQDGNGRYTVEGIAKTVMPSIVEIYTYQDNKLSGSGSGIILTPDGYIVTNAHVVRDADTLSVTLFDEAQVDNTFTAKVVGHDTKTDIAVIKITASGLKPAALGDSDDVQLGEAVCALGNPAGLSGSITTGIISGMNRKVRAESTNLEMECFQTDAAISPGNSGGALVDMYGRVIGITSSKYSSKTFLDMGTYEGLGFAITINEALPLIKELIEQGYIGGRVRIGIEFYENDKAMSAAAEDGKTLPAELVGRGILIAKIAEDSDLQTTELQPGDWILEMNGHAISDYDSVTYAIEGLRGGDSVHCRCARILEDSTIQTFELDFRLLEDTSGEY